MRIKIRGTLKLGKTFDLRGTQQGEIPEQEPDLEHKKEYYTVKHIIWYHILMIIPAEPNALRISRQVNQSRLKLPMNQTYHQNRVVTMDECGKTILHYIAEKGHTEVIKGLEKGVEIDVLNIFDKVITYCPIGS
ncbi:hypothetical protein NPIL_580671 [Nephila pilipes]|uniref:Uncharacterized protein n=1 Tax=Nephila pilipes TaxID=299642 RepID=A0A8X6MJL6_NEPPI|nr:hypothetical protein NPIL_580671 [Nephila pilipes]